MRLYAFTNFYLSSIQQGIQTAHIVSELFAYPQEPDKAAMIKDWAVNHKTIVVCNGGNADSLSDLMALFHNSNNQYPWIEFREDEQSLNGALTAVGIVLPPEVYDVKSEFRYGYSSAVKERTKVYINNDGVIFHDPESYIYQLIDTIKSAPLAR